MHIAILAPSHKSFIVSFLQNHNVEDLPEGYFGAPFIGTIILELLKQGHQVTAITTSASLNGDYSTQNYFNGRFSWIVIPSRPRSFGFNGLKFGRIVDFYSIEQKYILDSLLNIKPDIIHAHWSYEFAGAAIKSGIPFLVTVHDNAFVVLRYFKNLYRFFRLLMSEKYLKKIKYASTPSPYIFKYVRKRCDFVKIIPNPVPILLKETEVFSLVESKIKSIEFPVIAMIFNGWDERKNGKNALKGFELLLKRIPNAKLNLFGAGTEMYGEAYNDAMKMNIENLIFNGVCSHSFIMDELKNSHLLLHSSLEESFGVVLIEAMSFGVPAIGGKNAGAGPWVNNNESLLVDVNNPFEIENKMFELLTNKEFYKSAAILGFSNVVNRFSSKTVVNKYLAYYDEILNNQKW